MFSFTRKLGGFECFLNSAYSVKPRKIAALSVVPCQQNHALNVARLLQIDVKCVAKFAFVRGNLSKRVFCRKTHRFLPLYVLGNRSKTLLLPIIGKHTDLPTASRLRSKGTSPKFHRLNLNSSRDRICTFFRFRMDMDHYVLSSLASLLFPEP